MARVTRRAFISTAGAATGAAALALAGPGVAKAAGELVGMPDDGPLPDAPVVAYVRDPKKGRVSVMVGDREVAVQDPALVQRIVRAAR